MDKHYDHAPVARTATAEYDGRRLTLHASQLGGCPRAIIAPALGYEGKRPPGYHTNLMAAGHSDEVVKRDYLRAAGLDVGGEQREIVLELTRANILGAIDGIASAEVVPDSLRLGTWDGRPAILELKSMSDAAYRRWPKHRLAEHRQYAIQISVYMHALDLPSLLVASRRTTTPGTTDFDITYLEEPPYSLDALQEIIDGLLLSVEANEGQSGAEEWPACPKEQPHWCPFEYLHDGQQAEDNSLDRFGDLFDMSMDVSSDESGEQDALETRRQLRETRRIEVATIKRDHVLALHRETLAELVPTVPAVGVSIHIVSNASTDFWDFCPFLLTQIGPAHLHASTWSMNRGNALELLDLLDSGRLLSVALLTGSYFKSREHAVYATLMAKLQERGQRLLSFWNHSKIMVLVNETHALTIESSANFTQNPRVEQYVYTHDRPLAEFHVQWMEEMLRDAAHYARNRPAAGRGT